MAIVRQNDYVTVQVPAEADGEDVTCEVTAVNIAGESEAETSNAIEASVPE